MITFVDTNVLFDVFLPDPEWGEKSKEALEAAYEAGSLIINEIIYAELASQFPDKPLLDRTLDVLGIQILFLDLECAYAAGEKWKSYLPAGGKRNRVPADFLIAAHAEMRGDRLLTRDRGFYRKYFENLPVVY